MHLRRTLRRSLAAGSLLAALSPPPAAALGDPYALIDLVQVPARCTHVTDSSRVLADDDSVYFVTPPSCDTGMGLWRIAKDGSGLRRLARDRGETSCGHLDQIRDGTLEVWIGQLDDYGECRFDERWFADLASGHVTREPWDPLSPSGTRPQIPSCPNPRFVAALPDASFWQCPDGLWRRGFADGPDPISRILDRPADQIMNSFRVDGDVFYFVLEGRAGSEIWRSDGSRAGTEVVDGPSAISIEALEVAGGRVLFTAERQGGSELRVSDGHAGSGSSLLLEFASDEPTLASYGDFALLWFRIGSTGAKYETWLTDGSVAGTYRVAERWLQGKFLVDDHLVLTRDFDVFLLDLSTREVKPSGILSSNFFTLGDAAYAIDLDRVLWRLDAAGPVPISTLGGGIDTRAFVPTVADRAYLWVSDELWVSDGTPDGTHALLSLDAPTQSSEPEVYGRLGDRALIRTMRPSGNGDYAMTLWATDGTVAGTDLLVNAGDSDGFFSIQGLTPGENAVYFLRRGRPAKLTTDGRLLSSNVSVDHGSDGPPIGAEIGGGLVLGACSDECGIHHVDFEAGRTTLLVADGSGEARAVRLGDRVVVAAQSGLFVTDGSEEGTELLAAYVPGTCWARRALLFPLGERAVVGCRNWGEPTVWWSTDGTPESTFPLDNESVDPSSWWPAQTQAFFLRDGLLWTTDATDVGTRSLVAALDFEAYGVVADTFYFLQGDVLWKSDGTEAGTLAVAPAPFPTAGLHVFDGRFFMKRNHAIEVWDPETPELAPRMLALPSDVPDARPLGTVGDFLLLSGTTEATGRELLTVPLEASVGDGCPERLDPRGARARVRARARADGGDVSWAIETSLHLGADAAAVFAPEEGGLRVGLRTADGALVDRILLGRWSARELRWAFHAGGERVVVRGRATPDGGLDLTLRAKLRSPTPLPVSWNAPVDVEIAPIRDGAAAWCATATLTDCTATERQLGCR